MNLGPWAFGWNQLLPIIGFVLTAIIAFVSLKTFDRWKREKIEEQRIQIAFDALAIAYETKAVFSHIRGTPYTFQREYLELEKVPKESEEEWNKRGRYFAVLKRIEERKDFFDRVWKLQPRFMAAFGPETEKIFEYLHTSVREIEVACRMLAKEEVGNKLKDDLWGSETLAQMRHDVWDVGGKQAKEGRVTRQLDVFRENIERICRPMLDRQYARMLETEDVFENAAAAIRLLEESRKKKRG
jgi:hypothetical protein